MLPSSLVSSRWLVPAWAVVATAGWITQSLITPEHVVVPVSSPPEIQVVERVVEVPVSAPQVAVPRPTATPDASLRAQVRREVWAELRARHHAHASERLDDELDQLEAFARSVGLSDEDLTALESAVMNRQEQLHAIGPPPHLSPEPPDDGHREAVHAVFDGFRDEVAAVLGEEKAASLHEWMRPDGAPPPRF